MSYAEYRLREAHDESGEWHEDDEELTAEQEIDQQSFYAPYGQGQDTPVNPKQDYNDQMFNQVPGNLPDLRGKDDDKPPVGYYIKPSFIDPQDPGPQVTDQNLDTLGMSERPMFAQMPQAGNELAQAAGPGPDEDPEDWQAKKDIEEVAGVYGLKLGSTKSGKLVVQGNRNQWRQDFPDYASAMQWVKANMDKVGKR